MLLILGIYQRISKYLLLKYYVFPHKIIQAKNYPGNTTFIL